ncbi:PhzF family phenazine biosynthesis protein [Herbaspirillum sp. NPDC087042]|uniref:PhzF family phenazine biosynthesis protein n=1 Tax=Herbaspirillum sp. NPDC087042 TaxID=3364004 RepID=UPI003815309F
MHHVEVVKVFTSAAGGGNPAPIVISADGLDEADMLEIARTHGHESGFVFSPDDPGQHDFRLRYFVPRHEMSMCGHATIGAVWLLARRGRLGANPLAIQTLSGSVQAFVAELPGGETSVEISQPTGSVVEMPFPELRSEILAAMGLRPQDALDLPFLNACTSRIKTLIPLRNPAVLDAARPDPAAIERLCERIDSTGLYPFAADPAQAQVRCPPVSQSLRLSRGRRHRHRRLGARLRLAVLRHGRSARRLPAGSSGAGDGLSFRHPCAFRPQWRGRRRSRRMFSGRIGHAGLGAVVADRVISASCPPSATESCHALQ